MRGSPERRGAPWREVNPGVQGPAVGRAAVDGPAEGGAVVHGPPGGVHVVATVPPLLTHVRPRGVYAELSGRQRAVRGERLERVLQTALLGLEAASRPPRDAEVAADSLQGGGTHAEVLRGFLEVFREVHLEHFERDAPRGSHLARLGAGGGRDDTGRDGIQVGDAPAEGVEVVDVRGDGLDVHGR